MPLLAYELRTLANDPTRRLATMTGFQLHILCSVIKPFCYHFFDLRESVFGGDHPFKILPLVTRTTMKSVSSQVLGVTSPKNVAVLTARAGFLRSDLAAALWVSVTDLPPSPRVSLRPSHSKGLFYQVGGDREPVDFSNRFLERTRVFPIGGVA